MVDLAFQSISVHTSNEFLTCHAILHYGAKTLYIPSEGRHAADFTAPNNPMPLAGIDPVNLGSYGKHH
jgi:hypothetical protein